LESMIPVIRGELPMMVTANDLQQIQSAVAFSIQQKTRLIILGGYDAPLCSELLKRHNVPVILSAVYRLPQRRNEAYDAAYTLPRRLQQLGVQYCISGTDRSETWNARILPDQAATAVAYGLDPTEALRAITLYPAQILGVNKSVGSLEKGKDATFFISDQTPLEITNQVEKAFIQGREVDLSDRHKRLYRKYQEKYKQQQK
ncbi:MAG: amidohydrolase family protein, partial [Planctomycetota bacterium]|nr:amidohydrolase family protein [Planctomycetota bacterium]